MKVSVTRSGGFAGMSKTGSIDAQQMTDDQRACLEHLLNEPPRRSAECRPDSFQYRIIVENTKRREIQLCEPLTPVLRDLVNSALANAEPSAPSS